MKTDSIQQLLEKYREGTLSNEEREELNRLTHRDEVMASAGHKAGVIRRRTRMGIGFGVILLVVGGAFMWTSSPQPTEAPLVAEAAVPEEVTLPEPVVEQSAPAEQPVTPVLPRKSQSHRPETVAPQAVPASEEPVVMCNNQCEADSVISDIWKFLTA